MKKEIVVLVESYFRNAHANGICTKLIVDELYRQKHSVSVISSKRGLGDPYYEDVEGISVRRFNRSLGDILKNLSSNKNGMISKFFLMCSKSIFMINSRLKFFLWPLNSFVLVGKYLKELNKQNKKKKVDIVIGVYLHIEEVLASILFKRINAKTKLVIYTLDAMSGRTVPKIFNSEKIAKKSIQRWEKYVFSKADSICVMESHRKHYNNSKYDSIRHKIKYMDIPYLKLNNKNTPKKINTSKKNVVYTGYMGMTNANPKYFLNIISEIENIEFHIYGIITNDVMEIIKKSGLINKKVFLYGSKAHKEISKIQEEADVLVNFGNENRCMVPCKIFEYISEKKPILSFYKIEDDASYPYLIRYPNSLLIKEDASNIEKNLIDVEKFISINNFPDIDNKILLEKYYNNTPFPMVNEVLK